MCADGRGDIVNGTVSFNELLDSFDEGLTKKLKAVEREKDLKKMLGSAKEAVSIVKRYDRKISAVAGRIGNPQVAQIVLSGALGRIRSHLESQIDVLTDAV